jgi:hypothetical protein
MGNSFNSKKKEKNDQYFTRPDIVKQYIHPHINPEAFIIEPAAGNGDLVNGLTNDFSCYDIDPKHGWIIYNDFLNSRIDFSDETKSHVLMNPPFSKGLAVKFFNKAAEFANKIYIIAPRSWRKKSIQNRLDLNFHMIHDEVLPVESFYTPSDGKNKKVHTTFQIWERRDYKREKWILSTKLSGNIDFEFVDPNKEDWDFIIRMQGFYAGQIIGQNCGVELKLIGKSREYNKETFFSDGGIMCAIKSNIEPQKLYDKIYNLFPILNEKAKDCMGSNGFGKLEFVEIYEKEFKNN